MSSNGSVRYVGRVLKTGVLSGMVGVLSAESLAGELVLRYDRPAAKWRESLPLGNGHLGITVFGGISHERLQLSENSIYSGNHGTLTVDPLEAEYIKWQRETAIGGDVDAALALTFEEFKKNWKGEKPELVELEGFKRVSKPARRPVEQTLGDLDLFFPAHDQLVEDYERKLDLNRAVAITTYRVGDAVYTREAFCSYPDDIMVMKISCSEKKAISFSALLSRPTDVLALKNKRNLSDFIEHQVKKGIPAQVEPIVLKALGDDMMRFTGQAFDGGTKFAAGLKVLSVGGRVYTEGDRIHVEGADEAILMFSASTDYYHGEEWQDAVVKKVNAASVKSYDELLNNHQADYQEIFNRVDFSLGTSRAAALPTDVRLTALNDEFELGGADRDPQLYALHFQYGRYMLISSSRKGYFPPGYVYWCPDLLSEWFGGHATDINQQMNYWFADLCGMPEIVEPFFDVLDSYIEGAKGVAKYNYGMRGMMLSGFTPYGMTGPKDVWPGRPGRVGWPVGGGWFAQHYWEHYRFTQDEAFLKNRAYPFIKEAALFHLDYLAEDPKTGNLVSFPDVSPEGPFLKENGESAVYDVGTTFTLAVTREVLTNFIQASEILDVDEPLRQEVLAALPKIKPYRIGKYGQLQEWAEDYEDKNPGHRHVSHLYPVHPGYEITVDNNPELAEAARQSLLRRINHVDGYGYVGWSRAWFLNLAARLREPELAHSEVKILVSKCTYPNMLGTHQMGKTNPDKAVNCIDGNFGYTAGIVEMLLQSHHGNVHLLPALPETNWPAGYIRGIKARGGYEVDIEWKGGKLTRAVIRAKADGICPVRYGDKQVEIETKAGGTYVLDGNLKAGITTLNLSDFGAVGDGKTDDAAAFTQAMQAVHENAPNVVLKLEPGKIYKVGDREDSMVVFNLQHLTNVVVDGQGSMILNAPSQGYVRMLSSKNVIVKNLFLDNDPLSYTQGEVFAKNQQEGWFDIEIQPGFDLFFTDEEREVRQLKNWDYNLWGAIIDPAQRRIRPGKTSAYRVSRVEHLKRRKYRVHLHENSYRGIQDIELGDIYFQPRAFNAQERLVRLNGGSSAIGNIQIDHSSDCKIENVVMYGGRSTMTSRLEYNTGPITFDGFQLRFRPGFDERMVTNWRDGMHCKNNRVGPMIKNCHFEGLLDDSINISSDTIMAAEVLSDRQLRFCNWRGVHPWTRELSSVELGDAYMAFYPETGDYLGPFTVVEIDPKNRALVTFDKPVPNVVTGQVRRFVDNKATQFYNLNVRSDGYVIRNCTFRKQRNGAIRTRGINGLIEGNLVDGVNGDAVMLGNDYGNFYEGPFSQNVIIRNNRFINPERTPIVAYTAPKDCPNPMVKGIVIDNNEIVAKTEYAIELENVADVKIRNNRITSPDGKFWEQLIKIKHVSELEME